LRDWFSDLCPETGNTFKKYVKRRKIYSWTEEKPDVTHVKNKSN